MKLKQIKIKIQIIALWLLILLPVYKDNLNSLFENKNDTIDNENMLLEDPIQETIETTKLEFEVFEYAPVYSMIERKNVDIVSVSIDSYDDYLEEETKEEKPIIIESYEEIEFAEDENLKITTDVTEEVNIIPEGCHAVNGRSFSYITDDEYWGLVAITSAEARGEPFEGQVAVVEVILNRVESERYYDTVWDVICQKNAFASYESGAYKTAPYTESVIKAVDTALETVVFPKDVYFFNTKDYAPWGKPYDKIGNHYFCTGL